MAVVLHLGRCFLGSSIPFTRPPLWNDVNPALPRNIATLTVNIFASNCPLKMQTSCSRLAFHWPQAHLQAQAENLHIPISTKNQMGNHSYCASR